MAAARSLRRECFSPACQELPVPPKSPLHSIATHRLSMAYGCQILDRNHPPPGCRLQSERVPFFEPASDRPRTGRSAATGGANWCKKWFRRSPLLTRYLAPLFPSGRSMLLRSISSSFSSLHDLFPARCAASLADAEMPERSAGNVISLLDAKMVRPQQFTEVSTVWIAGTVRVLFVANLDRVRVAADIGFPRFLFWTR